MSEGKWDEKDRRANVLYYGSKGRWQVYYKPTMEFIGSVASLRHGHYWRARDTDHSPILGIAHGSRRAAAIALLNIHEGKP